MARAKARGGKKRKAGKKREASAPQRRAPARKQEPRRTADPFLATDADNDVIPSREVIGKRQGPVRCKACNTDFASRQDFEMHIADHSDIPAKIGQG